MFYSYYTDILLFHVLHLLHQCQSIIRFVLCHSATGLMAQDSVITTVKKRCAFNKDLKMLTEGASLILWGRWFLRWGAATEKARSPQSRLEHRTLSFNTSLLEWRLRGGLWVIECHSILCFTVIALSFCPVFYNYYTNVIPFPVLQLLHSVVLFCVLQLLQQCHDLAVTSGAEDSTMSHKLQGMSQDLQHSLQGHIQENVSGMLESAREQCPTLLEEEVTIATFILASEGGVGHWTSCISQVNSSKEALQMTTAATVLFCSFLAEIL